VINSCLSWVNGDFAQFFHGVGNYLRAEILHRAGVHPFARAREVIVDALKVARLRPRSNSIYLLQVTCAPAYNTSHLYCRRNLMRQMRDAAANVKQESGADTSVDVVSLCYPVFVESFALLRQYGFEDDEQRKRMFNGWLQCYFKQEQAKDGLGRTIWWDSWL